MNKTEFVETIIHMITENERREWTGAGVLIENDVQTDKAWEIYISVPEGSYRKSRRGEELAGMCLAKQFKERLSELSLHNFVIKARIRKGECWTPQMEADALEYLELAAKLLRKG